MTLKLNSPCKIFKNKQQTTNIYSQNFCDFMYFSVHGKFFQSTNKSIIINVLVINVQAIFSIQIIFVILTPSFYMRPKTVSRVQKCTIIFKRFVNNGI